MTSNSRHAIKPFVCLLLAIAFVFTVVEVSIAGSSPFVCMDFTGLITTSSGVPVQNGIYAIRCDIYEDSSGGIVRYSETFPSVLVTRGLYRLRLGSNPGFREVCNTSPLFTEITILSGPGGGFPLTFSPRSLMTGAPYAVGPWFRDDSLSIFCESNVGIGSTTPAQRLTIANQGNLAIDLVNEAQPPNSRRWHISSVGGSMRFRSMADDETTVQAEALSLLRNGNVGVGAIVPTEKLEVAGNIKASQFKLGSVTIRAGVGSPEGIVIGSVGDLFLRSDGGQGTVFYVKESGIGNTGWVAK
jgi:hypothetical protein